MPKMKKTKKQRRRTFPNMGSVSKSSVTRMRIPEVAKEKQKEKGRSSDELILLALILGKVLDSMPMRSLPTLFSLILLCELE